MYIRIRIWFISNLKTLELNELLLDKDPSNWILMTYHSFKVTRNKIWVYLWVYFDLELELRYLWMHENNVDKSPDNCKYFVIFCCTPLFDKNTKCLLCFCKHCCLIVLWILRIFKCCLFFLKITIFINYHATINVSFILMLPKKLVKHCQL